MSKKYCQIIFEIKEYASKNIVAKLGDFGLTSVLSGPYQVYIYTYI